MALIEIIFFSSFCNLDRLLDPEVAETRSEVTGNGKDLLDVRVRRPTRRDREAERDPGRLRSRGPGLKRNDSKKRFGSFGVIL